MPPVVVSWAIACNAMALRVAAEGWGWGDVKQLMHGLLLKVSQYLFISVKLVIQLQEEYEHEGAWQQEQR
jgi:hypothetical protein